MSLRWITAFLDQPRSPQRGEALDFWLRVTGSRLSPRRGAGAQFATLLPPDGDAFLRWQDLDSGSPGIHLDLHVDDLPGSVARAVAAGARVQAEDESDPLVLLVSPGGFRFCLVEHEGEQSRPAPVRGPGGRQSLVDQVCLDIPGAGYDQESGFWAAVTGWERQSGSLPEFDRLQPPPGIPLRLLLQRLQTADPGQVTGAHLDLACDDRLAEAAEHVRLGASLVRSTDSWTTLQDPAGRAYCLTGRDPATGRSR